MGGEGKEGLLWDYCCLPSSDLYSRKLLDEHLSRALNVELENGHLTPVDDSAYVLTLDYTIKMLNIHERSTQSQCSENAMNPGAPTCTPFPPTHSPSQV